MLTKSEFVNLAEDLSWGFSVVDHRGLSSAVGTEVEVAAADVVVHDLVNGRIGAGTSAQRRDARRDGQRRLARVIADRFVAETATGDPLTRAEAAVALTRRLDDQGYGALVGIAGLRRALAEAIIACFRHQADGMTIAEEAGLAADFRVWLSDMLGADHVLVGDPELTAVLDEATSALIAVEIEGWFDVTELALARDRLRRNRRRGGRRRRSEAATPDAPARRRRRRANPKSHGTNRVEPPTGSSRTRRARRRRVDNPPVVDTTTANRVRDNGETGSPGRRRRRRGGDKTVAVTTTNRVREDGGTGTPVRRRRRPRRGLAA